MKLDPTAAAWPAPNVCVWPTSEQAAVLARLIVERGLRCVSIGCGENAFEAALESSGVDEVTGVDLDAFGDVGRYATLRNFGSGPIRRVRPDELYCLDEDGASTCLCFVWGRQLPWRSYLAVYPLVPLVIFVGEASSASEPVATDPSGNALDGDVAWRLVHRGPVRAVHGGAIVSVYEPRPNER